LVFIGVLGFGFWGLGPIPNPQSPIPNPQSPIFYLIFNILSSHKKVNLKNNINIKIDIIFNYLLYIFI